MRRTAARKSHLSTERQVLLALQRHDFVSFFVRCFQIATARPDYVHGRYVEAIAHQFERCRRGEIRRLIVNLLPRSAKSIIASVAYPAWLLGHDPTRQIICVSYSADLAAKHARDCRAVMTSAWYRECFPQTRLDASKSAEMEFMTTRRGFRLATSTGGTLTGRGGDTMIIDDPAKPQDAKSKILRDSLYDWFHNTLLTRLNNRDTGTIILVMHRLHEDDLSGHLLDQGGWEALILPAIAEMEQRIALSDGEFWIRRPGDAIHPEFESKEWWERKRHEYGSADFSAQFQQAPVPEEGNLVRKEWLQWYDTLPARALGTEIVQSWDVASTTVNSSDWSVCTTWLRCQRAYYLLDVWRGRLEYPRLRGKLIELAREHAPNRILIEKTGPGLHLVQEFRINPAPQVPVPIGITPEGEKSVRMQGQSARFEAGQVFLPRTAPWLSEFLRELLAFPAGRHDDQVDSVSQFLNWAERNQTAVRGAIGGIMCFDGERWFGFGIDPPE
jgi:predicted phage terminase large subunit-like protein